MNINCDLDYEYINDGELARAKAFDRARRKERRELKAGMRLIVAQVMLGGDV